MTTFILLNGPRQVGKDFLADSFIDYTRDERRVSSVRKIPITWPLKLEAMKAFNKTTSEVKVYETVKDVPQEDLNGKTPREVYIEYGEYMRAEEGEEYFAKRWVACAKQYTGYKYIIVPDVRFQVEVDTCARAFGPHNTFLVHVYRSDYDWTNDIGSYLEHEYSTSMINEPAVYFDGASLNKQLAKVML